MAYLLQLGQVSGGRHLGHQPQEPGIGTEEVETVESFYSSPLPSYFKVYLVIPAVALKWNLYNFPTSRSSRCGHQAHWGEICRLPHHLPTAARMAPSRSHIKSAKTLIQIWLLFCTWSLWMDRDSYMPLQSFKYFQAKFQAKTWNQAAKRGESKSMKYVSYKSYICLGGLKKKLEFITHISLHPGLKVVSTS